MTEINKTFANKIEEIFLKISNKNEFEKNFSQNLLNKYSNEITPKKIAQIKIAPSKIAVAVSGGCDSLALLMLLIDFFSQNNHKKIVIYALTIDHKMRKNSSSEAKDLQKFLKNFQTNLKLQHRILTIPKNKTPQRNIEAKLRELRYELMINFCKYLSLKEGVVGENLVSIYF